MITARFRERATALPPHRCKAARDALEKFMMEPQPPGLRFEKLSGTKAYSIRSGSGDRILLMKEVDENGAYWRVADVGTHDIYRGLKRKR